MTAVAGCIMTFAIIELCIFVCVYVYRVRIVLYVQVATSSGALRPS